MGGLMYRLAASSIQDRVSRMGSPLKKSELAPSEGGPTR